MLSDDPRHFFLSQLSEYESRWPAEKQVIERLQRFVSAHKDCFERSLLEGHVTGSGLVVNLATSKVLLTHHAKLNKWLQLGGHSDGHPLVHETALRECEEESGLTGLRLFPSPPNIFDIDIHEIPERKSEPAHFHYDARYLVIAPHLNFQTSSESLALRWFSLEEAYLITQEVSMRRQFQKLEALLKQSPL